jgi:hypothetical protein
MREACKDGREDKTETETDGDIRVDEMERERQRDRRGNETDRLAGGGKRKERKTDREKETPR